MSATDELIDNNRVYAESFRGGIPKVPARKVAVLACMDARLDPKAILGLADGDAHVIRNAGGVVTEDAIRSLAISQHLLGTEEIVLFHHTDCGMLSATDEEVADRLERAAGQRPDWSARMFADLDADVRDSIRALRESPFIASKAIRGFVFDVDSGRLAEVA